MNAALSDYTVTQSFDPDMSAALFRLYVCVFITMSQFQGLDVKSSESLGVFSGILAALEQSFCSFSSSNGGASETLITLHSTGVN